MRGSRAGAAGAAGAAEAAPSPAALLDRPWTNAIAVSSSSSSSAGCIASSAASHASDALRFLRAHLVSEPPEPAVVRAADVAVASAAGEAPRFFLCPASASTCALIGRLREALSSAPLAVGVGTGAAFAVDVSERPRAFFAGAALACAAPLLLLCALPDAPSAVDEGSKSSSSSAEVLTWRFSSRSDSFFGSPSTYTAAHRPPK